MDYRPTPWGYEVNEHIGDIVSLEEFNVATGNKWSTSAEQAQAALDAAQQAVRDYCGWHVSPEADCKARLTGDGAVVFLPAAVVTGVTSVKEDGTTLTASTDYVCKMSGVMKRVARPWCPAWDSIVVEYTAGVYSPALAQVVIQLAANSMAAPIGVSSETVGSVSVSYNRTSGMAGGISLSARDKELLAPYRLAEVL